MPADQETVALRKSSGPTPGTTWQPKARDSAAYAWGDGLPGQLRHRGRQTRKTSLNMIPRRENVKWLVSLLWMGVKLSLQCMRKLDRLRKNTHRAERATAAELHYLRCRPMRRPGTPYPPDGAGPYRFRLSTGQVAEELFKFRRSASHRKGRLFAIPKRRYNWGDLRSVTIRGMDFLAVDFCRSLPPRTIWTGRKVLI